ncbi:hypothetical protein EXIGLDRAFT_769563 [Exidia glandulosa HHB12029]|uniref:Uncharacterized protein n=1 Tax=Exidia glandulosa HHB12029 TaxID=1314781 RepID=A0A165HCX6_EXIGL|nr:hypothetical protein EXIGLDRAFT_769563 [Exidia glandulosa HHB12029]
MRIGKNTSLRPYTFTVHAFTLYLRLLQPPTFLRVVYFDIGSFPFRARLRFGTITRAPVLQPLCSEAAVHENLRTAGRVFGGISLQVAQKPRPAPSGKGRRSDAHALVTQQAVTSFTLDGVFVVEAHNPATLGEDVAVGGGGALVSTTPTASTLYSAPTTFQAGALIPPSHGRPNIDGGLSRDECDQGAPSDNAFNLVTAAVMSPVGISASGVARILSNGSVQPPVAASAARAEAVEEFTILDAFSYEAAGANIEVSAFELPTDLAFWP